MWFRPSRTKNRVNRRGRKPSEAARSRQRSFLARVEALEPRLFMAAAPLAIGIDAGYVPSVRVTDALTLEDRSGLYAFDSSFTGGVRVALGDINGDGRLDTIAGAGPGAGPHVHVFEGIRGPLPTSISNFYAYDQAFSGGVFVASGDVNGDGRDDIVTGAGRGGGPHVRVFSGLDGSELLGFYAYDPNFGGGVSVAVGDVNHDGRADIITGAGAGGGPHVRVFSGLDASELFGFFAYQPEFSGGVFVAAGDVDGDDRADIYTGAGAGGGPHVRVFSGMNRAELHSFYAYDPQFGGGVRVAAGDLDGDGRSDIITGAGPGAGPHVRGVSGVGLAELTSFYAIAATRSEGVFVAGPPWTPDPVVSARLAEDTGRSNKDGITTEATIVGTIIDAGPVPRLQAAIDGGLWRDINTSTTDHRGSFTLTQATLEMLLDGPIADGQHTVRVQATDADGDASAVQVTFTLDRAAPTVVSPLSDLTFFEDSPDHPLNLTGAFSGEQLVYSIVGNTNRSIVQTTISGVTLFFPENRSGQTQLTVRATKPNGLFVDDSFLVDVLPQGDNPNVVRQLANVTLSPGAPNRSFNLGGAFGDVDELGTLLRFNMLNGAGAFGLELFDSATPITVQNFLDYVTSERYHGSIVHRSVPGFILQGGGYRFVGPNTFSEVDRQAEIVNEPGISNARGTIAMAKLGGDVNSATSEFFFNLADNNDLSDPNSLDNQNGGFAVFGRVLAHTMSEIDNNLASRTPRDLTMRTDIMGTREVESPPNSGNFVTRPIREVLGEIPLRDYSDQDAISHAPVTQNNVLGFLNIVVDSTQTGFRGGDSSLTLTVSSSNPSVVQATLNNKRLTLDPVVSGTATITIRAIDPTGSEAMQTFTVTVESPDAGMVDTMPDLNAPEWQTRANGLRVWDVVQGSGEAVDFGDRISVHYTGWLTDGTQIDTNRGNAQPITFDLDHLIQGWRQGVPGMREGGIRRLYIPAELAYGEAGVPPRIPPDSDLVFEIKLLDVPL